MAQDGLVPLHRAHENNRHDLMEFLLKAGANTEVTTEVNQFKFIFASLYTHAFDFCLIAKVRGDNPNDGR